MKIKEAGKRLGLTLAAIATLSMTACGVNNSASPVVIQEEPEMVLQEVNETLPEETNEVYLYFSLNRSIPFPGFIFLGPSNCRFLILFTKSFSFSSFFPTQLFIVIISF